MSTGRVSSPLPTSTLGLLNELRALNLILKASGGALELKSHAGFSGSEALKITASVQTTGATDTSIFSATMQDNRVYRWIAMVVGREASAGTERASFYLTVDSYRQGTSSLGVTTVIDSDKSNQNLDAAFALNGNNIELQVTGLAGTTINWVATIWYQGVGSNA